METVSTLRDVQTAQTRGGNTRYVARDADGHEYTTFREEIGQRAAQLTGRRVRIEYHEEQRGRYTNVYLDAVDPVAGEGEGGAGAGGAGEGGAQDTDPQEAAWRTAVEAAPWLVGKPEGQVEPEELYDKLKPFEDRVASDIEEGRRSE